MSYQGPKQFYEFIRLHRAGDLVTERQILSAVPDWKPSTLATYRKKHKISSFLSHQGGDTYRVVQDGPQVALADIAAALSQVNPAKIAVTRNDILQGERDSYRLLRRIGAGAVGEVWEAVSGSVALPVAVKICQPRPDLLDPSVLPNVRKRFRLESALSGKVEHPSIVRYLDRGEYLQTSFLTMDLAECSIADRLARSGPMSVAHLAEVLRPVAEALEHLHGHSCVHRDVKPPNLLQMADGVVLGDLGIVQWGDLSKQFTGAGTLTRTAVQLGSWYYMAPEQLLAPHGVTPASDIYALGVTAIELATGIVPIPQSLAAGRFDDPTIHAEVNELIRSMVAYEPRERPTARAVADVLARASIQSGRSGARQTSLPFKVRAR